MRIWAGFAIAATIVAVVAAWGGGSSPSNSPPPAPRDSFAANIFPLAPPAFTCVPPGAATVTVMQKLNAFWQSGVVPCACDAALLAAFCAHNAFASPQTFGYIFYDAAFLNSLDVSSGSTLPADFFIAHEFGHNIQLALGLVLVGQAKELNADCLGGYYVGFQARKNLVSLADLQKTFAFACSIGDTFPSNWWDSTHGICPQRVAAMNQGFNGNLQGLLPGQACPASI